MAEFDIRSNHNAPGDDYYRRQAESNYATPENPAIDPLETQDAKDTHRQLLEWFYYEREKQSLNRLEMAMDADFYDNMQWDPDDIMALHERGQMPLVYNEIAPMVDWLIGTERRSRVDWKVLPRTEDDVQLADVKTKVLKYVSDINHCTFERSRAFADAVKVGIGWLDDGVRDDPTQDIIYSKHEDWRNVLWDSSCYSYDLSDARYVFRWKWVDEDVALAMFPNRQSQIRQGVEEATQYQADGWEEDTWRTPTDAQSVRSGFIYATGVGTLADAKRRRVRLIEGQYRKPVRVKIVTDGPMRGAILGDRDANLVQLITNNGHSIVEKVMMRVHWVVFTEANMLGMGQSVLRHNRFSLTPIWCYRRGRDRLPYGVIRRVRDMQMDLNKRASKALFMLNTNQIIADSDAVDDWIEVRDEVDRPDGTIKKKRGSDFTIRRDTDAATGQLQMMTLAANSIQKAAGVSNENLGRQTNAVSGEAIKARQLQGSVVTTEPFDNLRLAVQIQGEKQLSLIEQFYTEEKVIRLSGEKGRIEWINVNQPELQADGSIRYINDITASQADFVVSEQDYAGTLRQVMFDSLNGLASRLPPEIALRLMVISMEFSDLPNKDLIADQIRQLTGQRDPNKPMSEEEVANQQRQMQMQAESMELQRQTALNTLEEQRAKIREINARAAKFESESGAAGAQGGNSEALNQIRRQADTALERVTEQLRAAQSELADRTLALKRDSDTKLEIARINADTKERIAEIAANSNRTLESLQARVDELTNGVAPLPLPSPAPEAIPMPAAPVAPVTPETVPMTGQEP